METKNYSRKILVIFASPRKGNSYEITKRFEKELNKLGTYDFDYVFLSDTDLKMCRGCHNCLFIGEDKCPVRDDRKKIYKKMQGSDGIALVSPVYVVNVSGLMKNFIDRMCFLCHRPELFSKEVITISTVAAIGMNKALKYMKSIAEIWGAKTVTSLGIMTPPKKEIFNNKNSLLVRKAAEKYHSCFDKPFRPSLNQVIQYEMQKDIFTRESAKKISPADYSHYMKIKDKNFNVPAKINPFKRLFARTLKRLIFLL